MGSTARRSSCASIGESSWWNGTSRCRRSSQRRTCVRARTRAQARASCFSAPSSHSCSPGGERGVALAASEQRRLRGARLGTKRGVHETAPLLLLCWLRQRSLQRTAVRNRVRGGGRRVGQGRGRPTFEVVFIMRSYTFLRFTSLFFVSAPTDCGQQCAVGLPGRTPCLGGA
jgi:hypothetical protein